jgi:hypothetical protein
MQPVADFVARVNAAIINPLLALIFTLALFLFLWGGFKFVASADSDAGRDTGKRHMLWGVIGMVLMVSVFAILRIFLNTFGVESAELPAELPLDF